MTGCPVSVRIPEFIAKVAEGKFEEAYAIIKTTNALPAVCGRVCPQEHQCEGKCVRGIKGEPVGIGRLERFCADYMMDKAVAVEKAEPNGHKVAVVGGGPSSLTVAGDLAKLGYDVTIYEAFHTAGGVLMYGIPEFRLPKAIVQHEIDNLTNMGVHIMTNMVIGRVLSIDELMGMGYEAVFVGSGAGLPRFMGIEGEGLVGVYSANEYLTRINLMKAYKDDYDTPIMKSKNVAVVGGGNVAMDAARSAMRLGAEHVYIVYRRSMDELPARKEEVHHAQEEGIEFLVLNNPVKIVGDENGHVKAWSASKWSWASLTQAAEDVLSLSRVQTSFLTLIQLSCLSVHHLTHLSEVQLPVLKQTITAALSLTRTSQQLRKAFTQAVTLLQALLLLSSLWVQAKGCCRYRQVYQEQEIISCK